MPYAQGNLKAELRRWGPAEKTNNRTHTICGQYLLYRTGAVDTKATGTENLKVSEKSTIIYIESGERK